MSRSRSLDEPGAFEVTGGEALWDAVVTALGKPGSALRVLLIGTRAPARSGWWLRLLDGGSRESTYIQELKGGSIAGDRGPRFDGVTRSWK